jgi:hypothetical protein
MLLFYIKNGKIWAKCMDLINLLKDWILVMAREIASDSIKLKKLMFSIAFSIVLPVKYWSNFSPCMYIQGYLPKCMKKILHFA